MLGKPEEKALNIYHLIIAPTYKCNLSCKHCYNDPLEDRVSLEEWKSVIDKWSDFTKKENKEGIVHFKGGEPFVYLGIEELATHAADKGLTVFFTTNGTFIDDSMAKKLGRLYENTRGKVVLSLNGSKSYIDEKLRQPGVYQKTVNAMEALHKEGVPFDVNYVLHEGNLTDLLDAISFADSHGAVQFHVLPLVAKGHAKKNGLRAVRTNEEIFHQLKTAMKNGYSELLEWSYADLVEKLKNGYECKGCTAGYRGLAYALPDGRIYSCPNTVLPGYELGSVGDDFEDIFNSATAKRLCEVYTGKLVCKGELLMYKGDNKRTEELKTFDAFIKEFGKSNVPKERDFALCFNRNF